MHHVTNGDFNEMQNGNNQPIYADIRKPIKTTNLQRHYSMPEFRTPTASQSPMNVTKATDSYKTSNNYNNNNYEQQNPRYYYVGRPEHGPKAYRNWLDLANYERQLTGSLFAIIGSKRLSHDNRRRGASNGYLDNRRFDNQIENGAKREHMPANDWPINKRADYHQVNRTVPGEMKQPYSSAKGDYPMERNFKSSNEARNGTTLGNYRSPADFVPNYKISYSNGPSYNVEQPYRNGLTYETDKENWHHDDNQAKYYNNNQGRYYSNSKTSEWQKYQYGGNHNFIPANAANINPHQYKVRDKWSSHTERNPLSPDRSSALLKRNPLSPELYPSSPERNPLSPERISRSRLAETQLDRQFSTKQNLVRSDYQNDRRLPVNQNETRSDYQYDRHLPVNQYAARPEYQYDRHLPTNPNAYVGNHQSPANQNTSQSSAYKNVPSQYIYPQQQQQSLHQSVNSPSPARPVNYTVSDELFDNYLAPRHRKQRQLSSSPDRRQRGPEKPPRTALKQYSNHYNSPSTAILSPSQTFQSSPHHLVQQDVPLSSDRRYTVRDTALQLYSPHYSDRPFSPHVASQNSPYSPLQTNRLGRSDRLRRADSLPQFPTHKRSTRAPAQYPNAPNNYPYYNSPPDSSRNRKYQLEDGRSPENIDNDSKNRQTVLISYHQPQLSNNQSIQVRRSQSARNIGPTTFYPANPANSSTVFYPESAVNHNDYHQLQHQQQQQQQQQNFVTRATYQVNNGTLQPQSLQLQTPYDSAASLALLPSEKMPRERVIPPSSLYISPQRDQQSHRGNKENTASVLLTPTRSQPNQQQLYAYPTSPNYPSRGLVSPTSQQLVQHKQVGAQEATSPVSHNQFQYYGSSNSVSTVNHKQYPSISPPYDQKQFIVRNAQPPMKHGLHSVPYMAPAVDHGSPNVPFIASPGQKQMMDSNMSLLESQSQMSVETGKSSQNNFRQYDKPNELPSNKFSPTNKEIPRLVVNLPHVLPAAVTSSPPSSPVKGEHQPINRRDIPPNSFQVFSSSPVRSANSSLASPSYVNKAFAPSQANSALTSPSVSSPTVDYFPEIPNQQFLGDTVLDSKSFVRDKFCSTCGLRIGK